MTANNRAVRNLIDMIDSETNQLRNLFRRYGNTNKARFLCEHATANDMKITDELTGLTLLISKCQFTEELKGYNILSWIDEDDLHQLYRAGQEWAASLFKASEDHMKYLKSKEVKSKAQEAFEEAYL